MTAVPPDLLAVALPAAACLAAGAAEDARSGRIPDTVVGAGALATTAALLLTGGDAAGALGRAAATAAGLWLLREAWYRLGGRDPFGLGDVKWSALAVLAFGPWALAWAWGLGAVLASLRIALSHAGRRPVGSVRFGPYMAAGLAAGLTMDLAAASAAGLAGRLHLS